MKNGRAHQRNARPKALPTARAVAPHTGVTHEDRSESALLGYLRTLARRKWIVLQALILVPIVATVLTVRQEARYAATASVLVGSGSGLTGDAIPGAQIDRVLQTEADLARMPAVAQRALARVRARDLTPQDFLDHSSVTTRVNSDILDFRVDDRSPARAQSLANAYGAAFTAFRRELHSAALQRAQGRLRARISALEDEGLGGAAAAPLERRLRELAASEATAGSDALIVRRAATARQTQPQPVRALALGTVLGVALGVLLAFLWDALDTRIRRVGEVGDRLGLPLLGRLRDPPRRLRKGGLVMLDEPHGPEAEAFRIVRANLEFATVDHPARVLMVTGAVDGDGRSTTVANLAVAFALAGRRVALADLDLRHPSLEQLFELERPLGITDVALGHVELEDAVVTVPIRSADHHDLGNESEGSLELLPSGPVPLDCAEFVGSRSVADVVEKLRRRAELVLLDAPPLLPVGDARIISGFVDGLVVVTNLALIRRPVLDELRRVLETCPTRILGFVATGVDERNDDVYGRYYDRRSARPTRSREMVA